MEPQYDKIIVLLIVVTAAFLTWKMVKDFYITKLHKVFAHLIAVVTSSFMLLSSMFLFLPKNYQRGVGPEVEITFTSIITVIVMLGVLYLFFKYVPSNKK
jgi:heme/copper-type cytochrome/quinol oxidase subunit 4